MKILFGQMEMLSDDKINSIIAHVEGKHGIIRGATRVSLAPLAWAIEFSVRHQSEEDDVIDTTRPIRLMEELMKFARFISRDTFYIRGVDDYFEWDMKLLSFWDTRAETVGYRTDVFFGLPMEFSLFNQTLTFSLNWLENFAKENYTQPIVPSPNRMLTDNKLALVYWAFSQAVSIKGSWLNRLSNEPIVKPEFRVIEAAG